MSVMSNLLLSCAAGALAATPSAPLAILFATLNQAAEIMTHWVAAVVRPAFPCMASERIRRLLNTLLFLPEPTRAVSASKDSKAAESVLPAAGQNQGSSDRAAASAQGGGLHTAPTAALHPKSYLVKDELKDVKLNETLQTLSSLVRARARFMILHLFRWVNSACGHAMHPEVCT